RREPVRRRRQQVERDDVIVAELRLQRVLGLELRIGIAEAHLDADGVELGATVRNAGRLERLLDAAEQRVVDLHRRLRRRDLDRRNFGKEVRQHIKKAERERAPDDDVFPERVAVHYKPLIVPFGSSCDIAPRCTTSCTFCATSTVTYCSSILTMRPRTPPAVTTSLPFSSASSIARASFCFFCCGRISRK